VKLEALLGPMGAGPGVEAFVGKAKALDGAAGDEVLVDDFGGVFQADVAVPDSLRVDDDSRPVFALVEAAGLVDADAWGEAGSLGELLDGGVELGLPVGVAGGAWGVLGTGVGTDKYMAFKRGQAVLLRSGDDSRVIGAGHCVQQSEGVEFPVWRSLDCNRKNRRDFDYRAQVLWPNGTSTRSHPSGRFRDCWFDPT
jgi:hypothetical protein